MGYTTDFNGAFDIEPEPARVIVEYVNAFNKSRRMKRHNLPEHVVTDPQFLLGPRHLPAKIDEPVLGRIAFVVGGNSGYGVDGEFYIGEETGWNDTTGTVVDNNGPPSTQPGLWCQWKINEDGQLQWDFGEKFYNYAEWLRYLIDNVFIPNGYVLNGEVTWVGEDPTDVGTLEVKDNRVVVHEGQVFYKPKPKVTKVVECYQCGNRFDVECP